MHDFADRWLDPFTHAVHHIRSTKGISGATSVTRRGSEPREGYAARRTSP